MVGGGGRRGGRVVVVAGCQLDFHCQAALVATPLNSALDPTKSQFKPVLPISHFTFKRDKK